MGQSQAVATKPGTEQTDRGTFDEQLFRDVCIKVDPESSENGWMTVLAIMHENGVIDDPDIFSYEFMQKMIEQSGTFPKAFRGPVIDILGDISVVEDVKALIIKRKVQNRRPGGTLVPTTDTDVFRSAAYGLGFDKAEELADEWDVHFNNTLSLTPGMRSNLKRFRSMLKERT